MSWQPIKPMKRCKATPCSDCPMRRKSAAGWLGADTPEHFIQTVHNDAEMPCHQTVDYEQRDWEVQLINGSAHACAGVAIYFANIGKLSRDSSRRRLPKDAVRVFASPMEFLKHHKSRP